MTTTKGPKAKKATETHDAASLAERIGTTVEAIEGLLKVGALNPVNGNEAGDELSFETEDLDALAAAISQQVEDEVCEATKGQPAAKRQFAVARAKHLVMQQARESANAFATARAQEIRLSNLSRHKDIYMSAEGKILAITPKGCKAPIEFGVGTELLKWGARLTKRTGATVGILDKKMFPALAGASAKPIAGIYARNAAVTGAVGAGIGAAKAGLDDDPETSVLGGALKGGAVGAGIGAGATVGGRAAIQAMLKKRGMANRPGQFLPA